MDRNGLPFGRWLVAILAVTVAAGACEYGFIPAYPGAGSRNPFPWSAVIDSFRFLFCQNLWVNAFPCITKIFHGSLLVWSIAVILPPETVTVTVTIPLYP